MQEGAVSLKYCLQLFEKLFASHGMDVWLAFFIVTRV
jgi:hypothetical protein